jgi:hypothetical protein
MTSNFDQVQTIYKISQVLSSAFQEVNNLCAHFLANEHVASTNVLEKKNNKPQK